MSPPYGPTPSRRFAALPVAAAAALVLASCGSNALADSASCPNFRKASPTERLDWLKKREKEFGLRGERASKSFALGVKNACSYGHVTHADAPIRRFVAAQLAENIRKEETPHTRHLPPASGPATRLLAGPIVFRIVGRKTVKGDDATEGRGYLAVFRLNQDPYYPYPLLTLTGRGKFGLGSRQNSFGLDYTVLSLGRQQPDRHCFVGSQPTGANYVLDPIKLGEPVLFLVQPFRTPGRRVLGRKYVRHPIMHASNITLTTPTATKLLKSIGCLAASREFFGSQ